MDPPLGAVVEVPAGRGIVRFAGPTEFAAGRWVGIELTAANGKNDGAVFGVRYFTCKHPHGVFVRLSQVKVIPPQVEVAPAPALAVSSLRRGRVSLMSSSSLVRPGQALDTNVSLVLASPEQILRGLLGPQAQVVLQSHPVPMSVPTLAAHQVYHERNFSLRPSNAPLR